MQENEILIDYFGESSFDAESYARKIFEHGPIEVAMEKVRELEALKKATEDVSTVCNVKTGGGLFFFSNPSLCVKELSVLWLRQYWYIYSIRGDNQRSGV